MSLYQLYRSSLKPVELEEWVDLAIYRPLGFLLTLPLVRTPITPNMVTVISALVGVLGGIYIAFGNGNAMLVGALLYALSNVLDCTDGMLARLTGKYSRLGQVYDGVADYVTGMAIFIGIGIGCTPEGYSTTWWWILLLIGGVGATSHQGMHLNHVREAALKAMAVGRGEVRRSAPINAMKKLFKRKYYFLTLFIAFYELYVFLEGSVRKFVPMPDSLPEMSKVPVNLRLSMLLWTFTGKGTHVTLLTLCLLYEKPELYCWLLLIPGYVYIVLVWIYHRSVIKDYNQDELR